MKNVIYKNFNKTDKQLLAQQIAAAYFYGLLDDHPPQNVVDARTSHAENIKSLERSLLMFGNVPNSHVMVGHLNERLAQERLWLKHFEKCALEHQRARTDLIRKVPDDKPKKKKGFWAKLFEDTTPTADSLLSPKEKRRRELAKQRTVELANELEVLAEVQLAADVAAEAQAAAKKKQDEEKRKAEEAKKQGNKGQQNQQRNNEQSRDSRRQFKMEDEGNKNDNKHSVEKETA